MPVLSYIKFLNLVLYCHVGNAFDASLLLVLLHHLYYAEFGKGVIHLALLRFSGSITLHEHCCSLEISSQLWIRFSSERELLNFEVIPAYFSPKVLLLTVLFGINVANHYYFT